MGSMRRKGRINNFFMVFMFAVMVFIGIFFFNCSMIPLTVVPSMDSVKPKIFYFANDPPLEVGAFVSHSQKGYVCYQYWYFWDHDGPIINYTDWESVYVYYCSSDGSLYALAHRVHWVWHIINSTNVQLWSENVPIIVFWNEYHTPSNSGKESSFPYRTIDLGNFVSADYELNYGAVIPEFNEPTDPWAVLTDAPDRTPMLYWRGIKYGFIGFGVVMVVGVLVIGGWGAKTRR